MYVEMFKKSYSKRFSRLVVVGPPADDPDKTIPGRLPLFIMYV